MLYNIKRIIYYLQNKPIVLLLLTWNHLATIIPDKLFLRVKFRLAMGYWMDFANPQTFNEKLQWLKLYNRKPEYTMMVDKYTVKQYVANIIGEEHIIPTLGVWENAEDIDFDNLPDKFVLKCNHDSGTGMCICKDKATLDIDHVISGLSKGLKKGYYLISREWPYKDVRRKVIAEQYMEDTKSVNNGLSDYKFYCYNGMPRFVVVIKDRFINKTTHDYFDMKWKHLPLYDEGCPNSNHIPTKPVCFEEMKAIASKLSQGIPHVRIDLYSINNKVYFGEYTFFDGSGFNHFVPMDWDYKFGEYIELPTRTK